MIATQVSSALRAATAAVKLCRVAPAALEVDGVGSFPKERFHQAVANEKSLQRDKNDSATDLSQCTMICTAPK